MVSFMLCNIRNYDEVIKCLGRKKNTFEGGKSCLVLKLFFLRAEIPARFKIKTHRRKPFLDLIG